MAFITVQEYKDFAGVTANRDDPRITLLIDSATSAIENYLGYSLGTDDQTERILTKAGRITYFLNSTNLSVVGVNFRRTTAGLPALNRDLEDTEYFVDSANGSITLLDPNNIGGPAVPVSDNGVLTINYNQDTDTVPDDIKLAAMLLVQYYFKNQYNQESISAGGQSVTFIGGRNFPPHVTSLLNLHRLL